MRTLGQIIEAAKSNQHLTHEELFFGLLTLDLVVTSQQHHLIAISTAIQSGKRIASTAKEILFQNQTILNSAALNQPDMIINMAKLNPNDPEYQRKRKEDQERAKAKVPEQVSRIIVPPNMGN